MSNTFKIIIGTISLLLTSYYSLFFYVVSMWGGCSGHRLDCTIAYMGPIALILYILFLLNKDKKIYFWLLITIPIITIILLGQR